MITVHFYAGLRELAKTSSATMPWHEGMHLSELRQQLVNSWPAITELLARSNLAVNDQVVTNDLTISDGAEVSLLPPVSGG